MENDLLRQSAKTLAGKINHHTRKEGLELTKMELGAEVFLINTSKIIIIYLLAALLGILLQTLTIHSAFALLKRYSFGLHALNSTVCTLVSCFMFVAVPLLLTLGNVGIGNYGVIIIFSAINLILFCYAPADTKARPIIGAHRRKRFKQKAVASAIFLMAVALLIPNESIKLLLTVGAVYQSISVLPFTYKILNRSVRNYEIYEGHGRVELEGNAHS